MEKYQKEQFEQEVRKNYSYRKSLSQWFSKPSIIDIVLYFTLENRTCQTNTKSRSCANRGS